MNRTLIRENIDELHHCFVKKGNEELLHSLGFVPNKEELLFHFFDDPDTSPELLIGSFINNKLVGFIHGIMRSWKDGSAGIGYIKWLQVNVDEADKDIIGRQLLYEIESIFRQRGCKQLLFGSASPYYLVPGVPARDGFTLSLLRDCGWCELSDRLSLKVNPAECDTSGKLLSKYQAENSTLNMSTLTELDLPLQEFIVKYFSESWATEVEHGLKNITSSHCSVLQNNIGDIIGFAAVNAVNRNWFGPMGIKPSLRGNGFGKMILLHAMQATSNMGNKSLILSWVNDKHDFYRKIFPSAKSIIYKKMTKNI